MLTKFMIELKVLNQNEEKYLNFNTAILKL